MNIEQGTPNSDFRSGKKHLILALIFFLNFLNQISVFLVRYSNYKSIKLIPLKWKAWGLFSIKVFLTIIFLIPSPYTFPIPPDTTSYSIPDSLILELPEKVISKTRRVEGRLHDGSQRMTRETIKNLPASMGDPIRAMNALPGVSIQNDFNARPQVRGGGSEEHQVFLDGIPLLYPYHFGSIFSILNTESIEDMRFYNSAFPTEGGDVLSGALYINSRRPSPDSMYVLANVSLLKGTGYLEAPIFKNTLAVHIAYQDLWYDYTVKQLLNNIAGDSAYEVEMNEYKKYVNLPNFSDFQYGAELKVNTQLSVYYTGISSKDFYNITIPEEQNIIRERAIPFAPQVNVFPAESFRQAESIGLDSLSLVHLNNQVHIINIPFTLSEDWWIETAFGMQWQSWDVAFANGEDLKSLSLSPEEQDANWYTGLDASSFNLDFSQEVLDIKQKAVYSGFGSRLLTFGLAYSRHHMAYNTSLPLPLYEMIANNNINMLSGLGYFAGEGFQIEKEDPSQSAMAYLGEYTRRLRFDHEGEHLNQKLAIFVSDEWELSPSVSLLTGLRSGYNLSNHEFQPEPRAKITYQLNSKNLFYLSLGQYLRDNPTFYQNNANPNLLAEKSLYTSLSWQFKAGENWEFGWSNYGKYNYDLISSRLVPNGNINLSSLLLPTPNTGIPEEEIEAIRTLLESNPSPDALDDETRQKATVLFGDYNLAYGNTGTAIIGGTEITCFYRLMDNWTGRVSADYSISKRQDQSETFYPYASHRPWNINWENIIELPNHYNLSLKYRYAAGQAYTPYNGTLNDAGTGSDLIMIGARNSARYAPYNRFDIRLFKGVSFAGHHIETYFEVWNAFNRPNYFLRDSKTQELKLLDLNLPFPFLFFGCVYHW
ncbi:MAG: TonB-dependent receptor plug domain-containing protein [Fibrobacteria bacterium]|nr:TonB-dependent receptor plug domain-containing protein [Fibrobacteria bacterium]